MKIREYISKSVIVQTVLSASHFQRLVCNHDRSKNLSFWQSLILVSLFFEETKQTDVSSLSKALSMTPSNLSHALSELESHHYIQRRACRDDARRSFVKLTEIGKRVALDLVSVFDAAERDIEAKLLHPETGTLAKSMHQVRDITLKNSPTL